MANSEQEIPSESINHLNTASAKFELWDLPLNENVIELLENYGITTLKDIAQFCTRESLLRVTSVGPITISKIEKILENSNLKLGEDLPLEQERRLFVIRMKYPYSSIRSLIFDAFNYLDFKNLSVLEQLTFNELENHIKDYLIDEYNFIESDIGLAWIDSIMQEILKLTNKVCLKFRSQDEG
jgi:hypothetical protein